MTAAVEAGVRAVVLREKDMPFEARLTLGRELGQLLDRVRGVLVVASDLELARALRTPWTHLAVSDPVPSRDGTLFGRSCHGPDDVDRAAAEGAAYVTASPLFPSAAKPGYGPALGLEALSGLCAAFPRMRVYALGGIGPGRARACLESGAHGIAVMSAVMAAADPWSAASALLEELPAS